MRIPPARAELASLHPTQPVHPDYVAAKHVRWWTSHSGDIYPHVLQHQDGTLHIQDGHHRLERARQLGQRWVWVRIHGGH
jgi:hypothetical protein